MSSPPPTNCQAPINSDSVTLSASAGDKLHEANAIVISSRIETNLFMTVSLLIHLSLAIPRCQITLPHKPILPGGREPNVVPVVPDDPDHLHGVPVRI